jgi:hypothetical protein
MISGGTSYDILHGTSHQLVLRLLDVLMPFVDPRGAAMLTSNAPCRFELKRDGHLPPRMRKWLGVVSLGEA